MKTAFIGGGQGCRDVLELVDQGRLEVFDLEVVAVCDVDPAAAGYRFALEKGWPTFERLDEALALDGLELVIELTGDEDVLDDIYFLLPPGVRLMDHVLAQVFWDLDNVTINLRDQLQATRELEAAVEVDRARLQEIVDTVHGAITIKDVDGRYQLANPRSLHLFGVEPADIIGRTATEAFPEEIAAVIERHDRAALEAREHYVSEEVIPIGGKDHVLISERFPLTDYKGDVVGLCCVARDDTRQREMRQEMLQQERLAAVGKLAAGVAHELNNPLTGILSFAEDLLFDSAPDGPHREDLEVIVQEAMRCRRIVRDLLDFSRQRTPHREPMDLNPVVHKTIAMVERQASFHDVHIWMELAEDMPMVSIDPVQIQQAILNLVINARDAMDSRGTLTIVSRRADDERWVVVAVSDTGRGIAEEDLGRIFEPFFSTKGDQGNGLGLPAVRSVMDQHGGRIEVDSKPGEGSTFRLVFPAA